MINLFNLSKAFHGKTLYEDVSLQISRGDRLALIGPNGAGKSTLFGLILGTLEADEGRVQIERGVTVGFLPQESAPAGEETILELATAISPEVTEIRRRMAEAEGKGEDNTDQYHDDVMRFDDLGGYRAEPKAKRILSGLGFRETDFGRPARELSGGWVMRAHLARLLVQEPDLLMLDEPTNHLDLETLIWFKNYLKNYPNSILLISHDRDFINGLIDTILDLRNKEIRKYPGNYDDYLEQKALEEENQLASYNKQQREIERLQLFADRFRAKASKASQAQSKLKQIERMDKIEAPQAREKTIKFRFPQPVRSGQKVITLTGIHQAYGPKVVYSGMDFQAEREQRIVLVGPNGAGKSTLLKILAGVLEFQQGTRTLGHNVRHGYFSQYRAETMNIKNTVLEEVMSIEKPVPEQTARTVLGSFLFRDDDVFKRVGVLSGGEKTRLGLVKMLLDPPNLLLMDEPTTHLDIASIDALTQALDQYTGTLIFISHDVYFIRTVANHVVHVNAGRLTHYPGGYQYYLDKTAAISEKHALTSTGSAETPATPVAKAAPANGHLSKEERRRLDKERQALAREKAARDKQVKELETQIADLETRQGELTEALENPETYKDAGKAMELNRELAGVLETLEKLNARWAEVAAGAS
ncbi:MAG: ABC-F family ATP-binding cassette domain-containing protein [Verrucomicrobiae bacterium]|nr:ABC-F family ATP-binding cassette domain-containing protein [Verrucomicrobiae bacterium]